MKNYIAVLPLLISLSAIAAPPQFNNLTKEDVENVTREFGVNFSHTVVSAPETDGLWGIEVGIMGAQSKSPDLEDVVQKSGGNGSDFKNIYNAGAIGRAHFPLELFVELSILPEQEFEGISVKSTSFGAGWNAGAFFGLPLDIAIGGGRAYGEISFNQTTPIPSNINLETTTANYWVGISKSFVFVTPYLKVGTSSIDGDFKATGSILGYTAASSEKIEDLTGGYYTLGANFELALIKLGAEMTKMQDVSRVSGKIALDF